VPERTCRNHSSPPLDTSVCPAATRRRAPPNSGRKSSNWPASRGTGFAWRWAPFPQWQDQDRRYGKPWPRMLGRGKLNTDADGRLSRPGRTAAFLPFGHAPPRVDPRKAGKIMARKTSPPNSHVAAMHQAAIACVDAFRCVVAIAQDDFGGALRSHPRRKRRDRLDEFQQAADEFNRALVTACRLGKAGSRLQRPGQADWDGESPSLPSLAALAPVRPDQQGRIL
jgi:hypothetical protein